MIKYKRVFRCDLCGGEKETEIEQGRVPFKYDPPEGWKALKDGPLLMCDACARKLAAPDPGEKAKK